MHGNWGPVTATLDWCEANYQFSHYVAEMANTFSNLVTIGLAVHGALECRSQSLPTRYVVGFVWCAVVGLGSMLFHASLLFGAQLADELPMIYSASFSCFLLLSTEPGFSWSSLRSISLFVVTLLFNALFSWSYYINRNPIYHQVVFALLVFTSGIRTTYLVRWIEAPVPIPEKTKSIIAKLFITGSILFTFGFFIWNLDNIFCDTLTHWKVAIGWPIAFLLEGHSWWHVFTGSGSYLMLLGITYLSLCFKDDHRRYTLGYTYGLPYVKTVPKGKKLQ